MNSQHKSSSSSRSYNINLTLTLLSLSMILVFVATLEQVRIGIRGALAESPDLSAYNLSYTNAVQSTIGGGDNAYITKNLYYDVLHTMIPSLNFKGTNMITSVRRTGMNAPDMLSSELDSAYVMRSTNDFITLNDNVFFERPSCIASSINERSGPRGPRFYSRST